MKTKYLHELLSRPRGTESNTKYGIGGLGLINMAARIFLDKNGVAFVFLFSVSCMNIVSTFYSNVSKKIMLGLFQLDRVYFIVSQICFNMTA